MRLAPVIPALLCAAVSGWIPVGAAPAIPDPGVPRPDLGRLFTPFSAPAGTYTVSTTARPIEDLTAALKAVDPAPAPGAWALTRLEAHDAFGQAGVYDRFTLAQLFGGRRVTVVRGSLSRGTARDAYTLISPYPDPSLTRLDPGTLVIVLHLDARSP